MSASSSCNVDTRVPMSESLPYLPPEIWLSIIEASTFVSGAFEPDIFEPSDDPEVLRNQKTEELLEKSYRTKRSLVRVCKQYGTPWLHHTFMRPSILDPFGRCPLFSHQYNPRALPAACLETIIIHWDGTLNDSTSLRVITSIALIQ